MSLGTGNVMRDKNFSCAGIHVSQKFSYKDFAVVYGGTGKGIRLRRGER